MTKIRTILISRLTGTHNNYRTTGCQPDRLIRTYHKQQTHRATSARYVLGLIGFNNLSEYQRHILHNILTNNISSQCHTCCFHSTPTNVVENDIVVHCHIFPSALNSKNKCRQQAIYTTMNTQAAYIITKTVHHNTTYCFHSPLPSFTLRYHEEIAIVKREGINNCGNELHMHMLPSVSRYIL